MFSTETSRNGFVLSNSTNPTTLTPNIPTGAAGGGDFWKGREINGSDFFHDQNHGLSRYRSAPSSFIAALLSSNTDSNSGGGGDESEAFFSALIDGPPDLNQKKGEEGEDQPNHHHHRHHHVQYSMKQEVVGDEDELLRPVSFSGGYVGSYSMGMENQVQVSLGDNHGHGDSSNLARHSSSPDGFFNGFDVMKKMVRNRADAHATALSFVNRRANLSPGPPSGSRFVPTASCTVPEFGRSRDANSSCWNEPPSKRNRDGGPNLFSSLNALENSDGESRKKLTVLPSHVRLPETSSEMAVENFLHFQREAAVVPCHVRAKRGCATHPRSIAERMRRNRISDNMKKLHDLFPSMDKQMNTADMLDLAVGYIKDLQKQVEILTDKKAKCVCSNKSQLTNPAT